MEKLYCSLGKKNIEINPQYKTAVNETNEAEQVKVGYYWASCSNIDECGSTCPKDRDIFR